MTVRHKIWSIAASDSSAGAGSQADLRMAHAMNTDCGVLLIAVTAQSSAGVQAVEAVPATMLEQQWQALRQDGWPAVIKIGWLPAERPLLSWLNAKLAEYPGPVIWDPVLSASQGGLPQVRWPAAELQALLRRADLLTPNRAEALALSGLAPDTSLPRIAAQLQQLGAGHLLISGGDQDAAQVEDWFFFNPQRTLGEGQLPGPELLPQFGLRHTRIARRVHGTGCHLATALACGLAAGLTLYDAVVRAVTAARLAIRHASARSNGYDNAWAVDPETAAADDWPLVVSTGPVTGPLIAGTATAGFPGVQRSLGLYGLVDNLTHLQRLLAEGIDTLQWRVKAPHGDYEHQTLQAIERCRDAGVPLYINDDWQLALRLGAYGVHLGQEDLLCADLPALAAAGIRLGISTHSDWEIARARALQPSYIALGPVFIPLSKKLRYAPLGCAQLAVWAQRFAAQRLTCIGGITPQNIAAVAAAGIDSAAVVTALQMDDGLEQRLQRLRDYCPPVNGS